MSTEVWALFAFVAELTFAVWTLNEIQRLRRPLELLRAARVEPEGAQRALEKLPNPERELTARFLEGVSLKSTLDEALSQATVRAAFELRGPPLRAGLLTNLSLLGLAVTPLASALLEAATAVAEAWFARQTGHGAWLDLQSQEALAGPFSAIPTGASASAFLLAFLSVIWATRWVLLRPEAREANFVRVLLELAIALRPGVPAAVSATLAAETAPDRALQKPALATVLLVSMVGLGFVVLGTTAPLRARRHQPASFAVWPETRLRPITIGIEVELPLAQGGRPIDDRPRPSLTLTQTEVTSWTQTHTLLTQLAAGRLPADWALPDFGPAFDTFPRPLELAILADGRLPMDTVVQVLAAMRQRHLARRFQLVIEREPAGPRRQASLAVELEPSKSDSSLALQLEPNSLRLAPSGEVLRFEGDSWAARLRAEVRRHRSELADAPVVQVRVAPEVTYGRFTEVLGVADSVCLEDADCGLPGLGLSFVLRP